MIYEYVETKTEGTVRTHYYTKKVVEEKPPVIEDKTPENPPVVEAPETVEFEKDIPNTAAAY